MENFADTLEKLIKEKLGLYTALHDLLIKEKSYVEQVKVEELWETTAEKKSLIYRLELIRHQLLDGFVKKYPGVKIEEQSFGLMDLIRHLNLIPERKYQFETLILSINTKKEDISSQAQENQRFIKRNLSVIQGIFSTIMDSREKEEEYSASGNLLTHGNNRKIFSAQV